MAQLDIIRTLLVVPNYLLYCTGLELASRRFCSITSLGPHFWFRFCFYFIWRCLFLVMLVTMAFQRPQTASELHWPDALALSDASHHRCFSVHFNPHDQTSRTVQRLAFYMVPRRLVTPTSSSFSPLTTHVAAAILITVTVCVSFHFLIRG